MGHDQDEIIAACEKYWEADKTDCSHFVRDVANELGVFLQGNANSIVDQINKAPWHPLSSGVEAAHKAVNKNVLVIGGLKADGHGHVVVVVSGPLTHGKYPMAYWGSIAGVGRKNEPVTWSWTHKDLENVIYSYIQIR